MPDSKAPSSQSSRRTPKRFAHHYRVSSSTAVRRLFYNKKSNVLYYGDPYRSTLNNTNLGQEQAS